MILKLFRILLIKGAFVFPLCSQIIYFSVHDDIARYTDIFEFDLSNCTYKQICDDQLYYDFSVRPVTNEWVQIEWVGLIGWYNMNYCDRLNWGGTITPTNSLFIDDAQESDRYGNIWLLGYSGIVKVNPPSNFYEFKGSVDVQKYGIGRATYLDGKFYSAGIELSNPAQGIIIEFDTANPMISRILCNIPSSLLAKGLFTTHMSCSKNSLLMATNNEFYEIDLATCNFNFLCSFQLPARYNNSYFGSSPWQYNPSDCDLFLDLDINNSSGDLTNGFINYQKCRNEIVLLTDSDPDVFSDYGLLDSIQIDLINALDGSSEEIIYSNLSRINGIKRPQSLTLIPFAGATNDSFKLALRALQYKNTACLVTNGVRSVRFIAFKNNLRDTAYCNLNIEGPFYNAGLDSQIRICNNDPPVSLFDYLGNCFTGGGYWTPKTRTADIYDPGYDSDSIYYYIVGDTICGYDTAIINISINSVPLFSFPIDTGLCPGDSLFLYPGISNASYLWNNGSNDSVLTVKNEGIYWLELTNSEKCKYRDSILVFFNLLNPQKLDTSICMNQIFNYKNKSYYPGEIILDTLESIVGCDTILQINLLPVPVPNPRLQLDTLICPGTQTLVSSTPLFQNYSWSTGENMPSIYAGKGTYTLTVTDQNACTNSIAFNILELPEINYNLIANDPLCDESKGSIILDVNFGGSPPYRYSLNAEENNSGIFNDLEPGTYYVRVTDSDGCSKHDTIKIVRPERLNISLIDEIILESGQSILIKYLIISGSVKLISFTPELGISKEGDSGLRIIGNKDIEYEIIFEDNNGCILKRILKVKVKQIERVYIPNAFSPNGDQVNDKWEPSIAAENKLKLCIIYDRWGNMVYKTESNASWNGLSNNQKCLPGVYLYYLEVLKPGNILKKYSGELTLIR